MTVRNGNGPGAVVLQLAAALIAAAGIAHGTDKTDKAPAKRGDKPNDVISLLERGVIDVELSAHGAYRLDIKVWNLTKEPVQVEFPPGLVADAFAQNEVLAQVRGAPGGGSGSSGGGSSGSQGLGLLNTPIERVAANQSVLLNVRTICLNFGLPEPTPRSPLFLKRVDEYTANLKVRSLLTQLARAEAPSNIAQYALWHFTNGLSWDQLSRLSMRMKQRMTPEDFTTAKQWAADATAGSATEIASAFGPNSSSQSGKDARRPSPEACVVGLQINPDPRGGSAAGLTRALAVRLREDLKGFGVSHGNALPRDDASRTLACWQMLIKAPAGRIGGGEKPVYNKPLTLTLVRSDWDDKKGQWRRDRAKSIKLAVDDAKTLEELTDAVSRQLVAELAAQAVAATYSAQHRELTLVNTLPLPVTVRAVRPRRDSATAASFDKLIVPARGKKSVPIAGKIEHEPGRTLNPTVVKIEI